MAFQDFDLISDRRKEERKQKIKKRIMIAVVSILVLIGLAAAAVFVLVEQNKNAGEKNENAGKGKEKKESPSTEHDSDSKDGLRGQKMVKTLCSSTDFKSKCETSLGNASKGDPKLNQPKDLLEVAIKAAEEAINKAFDKSKSLKFESEKDKGAFEDCKQLIEDAKEEIGFSLSEVGKDDLKTLVNKTDDVSNWLSAVISYHETCIDGFPDGKLKTDIKNIFKDPKEFVSNALAIMSDVASLLSTFQSITVTTARHLLEDKASSPADALGKDGLPDWMGDDQRRVLKAADDKPTPNVTVAKDGSGQFKTISEALAAIPEKYEGRYVVYVKEGVYEETVTITKKMVNITLYGDSSQKSIITGSKNFVDGVRTFQTATFVVLGEGFLGKAMGFRNTAGPEKHQAVAVRVQADRAVFVNSRFEGYQDTLYTQTHRQFYRSCVISGTVDFIFGDAAAVFQNCIISLRKPLDNQQNIVTAQGRIDKRETTALVLQNCQIKADDKLVPDKAKIKSYLGRPWKEYSTTIVMESEIEDVIHPDGWLPWEGDFALKTLFYGEFNNTGPGASTSARVKWPGYKVLTKDQAKPFTVGNFMKGTWIISSVPVQIGFYH
ncbi:hypothetical protein L6164_013818 [Bauhinia variegata]|uniref:Uncharacterized protein n=1 Tax=Bauhinia variegata TaxID=167791 RepID=A0ACB9NGA7_BAUVA|nr:hypothetical protein L6164_013818 [Bauhinia variegata]